MTESKKKISLGKSLFLFCRGKFFNVLVFMFLIKKDWKQHAVSILALGSLIFVGSVMSYLVATNFFGWDNRSDLSPFYLHASDFLTNFMSLDKLTFLLTAFGIGWLVNWTTPHCAKYQSKRKDKFNTAWELEISTGAVLIFACNAISTVFAVIIWTGALLMLYSKFVEGITELNEIIHTMLYCFFGYVVLNLIVTYGLCDYMQTLKKQYKRRPVRVKRNNRKRTIKNLANTKTELVLENVLVES